MNLPTRSLQALVDLKRELLAPGSDDSERPETSVSSFASRPSPSRQRMRRARVRGASFQRMCRRRDYRF